MILVHLWNTNLFFTILAANFLPKGLPELIFLKYWASNLSVRFLVIPLECTDKLLYSLLLVSDIVMTGRGEVGTDGSSSNTSSNDACFSSSHLPAAPWFKTASPSGLILDPQWSFWFWGSMLHPRATADGAEGSELNPAGLLPSPYEFCPISYASHSISTFYALPEALPWASWASSGYPGWLDNFFVANRSGFMINYKWI